MKKFFLICVGSFCLTQCSKNDTTPEDVRLVKIKYVNAVNDDVYYLSFEYDQSGRITKLLSATNDDTPVANAIINYGNNRITILPTPIHNSSHDFVTEIVYFIDATNKPTQRTENVFREYKAPSIPQRDFETDTANYEYDAAGLLFKITGKSRDSVWQEQGPIRTWTDNTQYTALYTNAGGNLTGIAKTASLHHRHANGAASIISLSNIEETYTFGYDHAYANKTDFTNALVLTEFEALYEKAYPINKNYQHIPDRISYSKIVKDAVTGNITESSSNITNAVLNFNFNRYITSINFGTTPDQGKELIYSK